MSVPQTCYMAQVIKRQMRDRDKKLILTQIKQNGKTHHDKGPNFLHYEKILLKDYDDKKIHRSESGDINYIEYIKDGKCIIFCEYIYDCYYNDHKVDMVTYMTWEG